MREFIASCLWDATRVPLSWLKLCEGAVPEQCVTTQNERSTFAFRWAGPERTKPTVVHAASWTVAVSGKLRRRTHAAQHLDPLLYLADALANRGVLQPLLDEFDGEYALVAWDADSGLTCLATDPVGNRALYYTIGEGGLICGSHPQRIAALNGSLTLDPEALHLYFALKAIPAPWSILSGVHKVRPGHLLVASCDDLEEKEYWPLVSRAREPYEGDFQTAQAELRDLLVSAIRRDAAGAGQSTGLFLSGGLDSTVLMALARQAEVPLQAFSVGYEPRQRTDETYFAGLAAGELGAGLEVYRAGAAESAQVVREMLDSAPEPVNDMAFVPQLLLARPAAGKASAILDGTGADSVLGGSNKYKADHLSRRYLRIPQLLRRAIIQPLSQALPASRRWRITDAVRRWQIFAAGSELAEDERRFFWSRFLSDSLIDELLQPEWRVEPKLAVKCLKEHWERLQGEEVSASSFMTLKTILPGVELLKHSHLEAMTGISIRKPFLAPPFIEFALRMPDSFKVPDPRARWF